MTNEQVSEQKVRFENLLAKVNMVKLGQRIFYMNCNDAKDGRFTPYVYVHRILRRLANVKGSMYYPVGDYKSWEFYSRILEQKATAAYIGSIQTA